MYVDIQPVILSVPWPFFKLAGLIVAIVVGYFALFQRYHMRLFGIK
jgi:uncharacterized membrane protein SirB2